MHQGSFQLSQLLPVCLRMPFQLVASSIGHLCFSLCYFSQEHFYFQGNKCPFLHRKAPPHFSSELCKFFANGNCKNGERYVFVPGAPEIAALTSRCADARSRMIQMEVSLYHQIQKAKTLTSPIRGRDLTLEQRPRDRHRSPDSRPLLNPSRDLPVILKPMVQVEKLSGGPLRSLVQSLSNLFLRKSS